MRVLVKFHTKGPLGVKVSVFSVKEQVFFLPTSSHFLVMGRQRSCRTPAAGSDEVMSTIQGLICVKKR